MQTANNSLTKKKNTGLIEYTVGNEIVKISSEIVRRLCVKGGGNPTDEEVDVFISQCKFKHMNPFVGEAHLIKYGQNDPAAIVTGKDTFTKRARNAKDFDGFQAGIIVQDENGVITEREGAFRLPNEEIVGGWAKCYIKGQRVPHYESVSYEEYVGRKKDGTPNRQWATKPATMIRKVALVHVLRETFPEDYSGLYSPEEIPEANFIVDAPTEKIIPNEPAEPEKIESGSETIPGQMDITNPAMAALMGE